MGGGAAGDVAARLYCSIPSKAGARGSEVGSNSEVYFSIERELLEKPQDVEEAHLALYLFNNKRLYSVLRELSSRARVTVVSTPLSAYDRRKIGYAREIYGGITDENQNLRLLIYPHMYVWHGAEYAEAGTSYSLHVKSGYITYRDGSCKLILTSCNMSPGDPYHSELAVVLEDPSCSSPYSAAFKKFFEELESLSIPWGSYRKCTENLQNELQVAFSFAFLGGYRLKDWSYRFVDAAFFTGPFITIRGEGSTHYARRRIVDAMRSAERRILVCAQHVHDIAPFNSYEGPTLIETLAAKKHENPRARGVVFQDPFTMLFARTVGEEISFGPLNIGVPRDELPARVEEAACSQELGFYTHVLQGQLDIYALSKEDVREVL